MNYKIIALIFIGIFWTGFSQVHTESDTLLIKFSKDLLGDKVYINTIDIYGNSIKKQSTEKISFLFTSPNLKNDLLKKNRQDSIERAKKDKNPNYIRIIRGYSSGPPLFGIELNHYELDSTGLKSHNNTKAYYDKTIESLRKYGAKEEQIKKHRKNIYATLTPPLKHLYVDKSFLKENNIFEFTGSEDNYLKFLKEVKECDTLFILMPFNISEIYNYDYHLIQVNNRYIAPRL